jgi:hypothetical protein
LLKIDTNGNLQWAHNYGGSAAATSAQAIAVDSSQNIYLGGTFLVGSMTNPGLTRIGSSDAFLMKLNSSGVTQWAHNYGGSGATAAIASVAVDSTGNVAAGGYFLHGPLTTPYQAMVSTTDVGDALVLKVSSTGSVMWSHAFGGSHADTYGVRVSADTSGNIVMTGNFSGGNMTYPAITDTGPTDVFAVEMNTAGTPVWALNLGAANTTYQVSNSGSYLANGTRYIVLGGEAQVSGNANSSPFLLTTPIQ